MKSKLLFITLLIGFCGILKAHESLLTFSDGPRVIFKALLEKIHQDDLRLLPENDLSKYAQMLIQEYERAPQKYPEKGIFHVAVAYGYEGKSEKSIKILEMILRGSANDQKARWLLGIILYFQEKFPEAASHFKKAWANEDIASLAWLGMAYLRMQEFGEVKKLLPAMLKRMDENEELKDVLASYSQVTPLPDNEVFLRVIKGMGDEKILERPASAAPFYIAGLWNVGERGRALKIQSILGLKEGYGILTDHLERRKEVIDTYEKQPQLFAEQELKVVAISYMLNHQFDKAKPLYKRYLETKPKDEAAWRGLGMAYTQAEDHQAAIEYYKKGWELGGAYSLKGLAASYLATEQIEELKKLVPDMMRHKEKDPELLQFIVAYCINSKPPDGETFMKAIEGLSDEKILSQYNIAKSVILGLRTFGETPRADILEKKFSKQTTL